MKTVETATTADRMKARITRLAAALDAAEQLKKVRAVDSDRRYPEAYGWLSSAVSQFVEECKADALP